MLFMPFNILGMWLRGLFALALLGAGIAFLSQWYRNLPQEEVTVVRAENGDGFVVREVRPITTPAGRVAAWHPELDGETALLVGGVILLLVSFAGRFLGIPLLFARRAGNDDPKEMRTGSLHRLKRPDGTELQVECYGPPDAPPLVVTHGWGVDSSEWYYLKRQVTDRYRLIVWDLPGTGRSTRPPNNDYSLEKMARDLEAVVAFAGPQPVMLAGHSIGGMISLTFCRLFPEALGTRVRGLILVHTTYTNPVRTTKRSGLYTAIQKPVLEPLLYLTIGLSPLVWLMNCMSYLNGSAHSSSARQSFAGTETRGQLDFIAHFVTKLSPAVLARGMFGMLRYDATAVLPTIRVPVLVVAGDRDPTTKPEASAFIQAHIPSARLVTLSPAAHQGLIERNPEFATAVATFCATQQGEPHAVSAVRA